jgi:NAD-dependent deacetylase
MSFLKLSVTAISLILSKNSDFDPTFSVSLMKFHGMNRIVVLTGAGMSAESGLKTFRDHDGLWHNHRVEEVATPEAWERDMEMVLEFYNERRKGLMEAEPNAGHLALSKLEEKYDVQVITQNIDNLHERAGSSNVLHLHGELNKARSTQDPSLIYDIDGWELKIGDLCELGSQLRPHVVWFGEPVPLIMDAAEMCTRADIMIIIGTSLNVYPAAGLVNYAPMPAPKYIIDPKALEVSYIQNLKVIRKKAGEGVPELVTELLNSVKS